MRYIKVLRDNFSAVDLRAEPCHNGLSEKEKHGGKGKQRTERRAAEEQGDFASGSAQNALSAAASFHVRRFLGRGWCRLTGGHSLLSEKE